MSNPQYSASAYGTANQMTPEQMWNQGYAAYGYAYPSAYGAQSHAVGAQYPYYGNYGYYAAPMMGYDQSTVPGAYGAPYTQPVQSYGYYATAPPVSSLGDGYTNEGPPTKKIMKEAPASTQPASHSQVASSNPAPSSSPSNSSTAEKKGTQWPPALIEYVNRCYQKYTEPEEVKLLEEKLAEMVQLATRSGTLWERDWAGMPLPSISTSSHKLPSIASKTTNPSDSSPQTGSVSFHLAKAGSKESKPKQSKLATISSSNGLTSSNIEPKVSKKWSKGDEAAYDKKQQRAARFKTNEDSQAVSGRSVSDKISPTMGFYRSLEEDFDPSRNAPIIGTSTSLEKAYLRLTERVDPTTVRPEAVLKESLALMRRKEQQGVAWTYLGEQMKSIRQDLTIQGITNEFSVEVYETNARWCLERKDLPEFKRCLLKLKEFYDHLNIPGNVLEFTCYSLLYSLLTGDFPGLNGEIAKLDLELKTHPQMRQIIQICDAYLQQNWFQFFKLSKNAHNKEVYLLEACADKLRMDTLKSIFVVYRPSIPLEWLGTQLSLPNRQECIKYLEEKGCVFVDKKREAIDVKASIKGILEYENANQPGK